MVNQTDARGTTVKFEYDFLNRLTKKDYPSDTDVVLTYDGGKIGTLSQADSPAGTVKYEYDNRLRQTAQNYTYSGSTWWTRQAYDSMDRVTNVTQSNGEVLSYTYNNGGMLESIPGYVTQLDYTALGKVSNRSYGNGLVSKLDYYSDSFRLKSISTGSLQNLSYAYDGVGNVLSMNDSVVGSYWAYGYDQLDRLVSAVEAGKSYYTYGYNSIGNLMYFHNGSVGFNYTYGIGAGPHAVSSMGSLNSSYGVSASCSGVLPPGGGVWDVSSNSSCSNGTVRLNMSSTVFLEPNVVLSLYNATLSPSDTPGVPFISLGSGSVLDLDAKPIILLNQQVGGSGLSFLYDLDGSMVNDSRFLYSYNDDERMSAVRDQFGSLKETYLYDQGGSRKVKITVLSPTLNKTTYYLSQSWIREEYSNGTSRDSLYVYGNNELLARKDSSGNKHYYHPDHLGSTTVVTNQTGSLDDRIAYEPYGQPRQNSQEMYQYTSQEWEPDFGIYDYDARQYNPMIMRFMQGDIIIKNIYAPQNLNRYSYTLNNPLKYIDPSGNKVDKSRVFKDVDAAVKDFEKLVQDNPNLPLALLYAKAAQYYGQVKDKKYDTNDAKASAYVYLGNGKDTSDGQYIDLQHYYATAAITAGSDTLSKGSPGIDSASITFTNMLGFVVESFQYAGETNLDAHRMVGLIREGKSDTAGTSGFSKEDMPSNFHGSVTGSITSKLPQPLAPMVVGAYMKTSQSMYSTGVQLSTYIGSFFH